jgi:F-type H+-transporting ATPase subunit a
MTPPKPSFAAETLFTIGGFFHVSNSMIMTLIVAAILVIVFARATAKMELVPGRLQNFAESIVEALMGIVESTAGKRTGRIIFPLIATLFIFIITANWLSLLPISWIGLCHAEEAAAGGAAHAAIHQGTCPEGAILVPFLRAPNADLNMTLAMALIAFIVVQTAGVIAHGPGGYLKELTTPIFLAPVHIIGELSRIISLSFRLFGNIFGGEVLLAVMYFLLGSIFLGFATIIFVGLEVLFGTIQALVFSLLTLVYISMAVAGHGDAEGHDVEHNPAGEDIAEHPQTGTEVAMG